MARDTSKWTRDRAVRRFSQMVRLERDLEITEGEIKDAVQHVTDAKGRLTEWREKRSALLADLRKAARDEGELPLLNLMELED